MIRAIRLAEAFAAKHPAESLRWDWDDAIFLYGVEKLGAATNDDAWRAYVARYHSAWRARIPPIDRSDRCAPALTAIDVAPESARAVAQYVREAPRNSVGAIDHLGTSARRALYPRSIWVDSLMMYAVFAAKWGARIDDAALVDFAASQPIVFARCLQSQDGLFRHAWLERIGRAVPRDAFWLRGNGWVVAAVVDILEVRHDAELVTLLDRVARALAARQNADGSWSTLVNAPSYPETSGTALVAYAIAKGTRRGWLAPELRAVAERAMEYATAQLRRTKDGASLGGISGATNALPAFAYRLVPRARDLSYGVGAYLMAASELR